MRPYPLRPEELVDDVLSELDAVTERVRVRFGGLSREQLAWQPSPNRWGVGHCLAHLARTNEAYRGALSGALRAGRESGALAAGPLRGRWTGRLFTRMVGPGSGVSMKSPGVFLPIQETVAEAALDAFLAEQHLIRAVAEEGRGLDLDALFVVSPASSVVRLTAGDALRALAAHELRHLSQAEHVMATPGFPR
ncbi:MAG: DinB family protein [Longimicrobiales bacterium]|nr:DinB family protein [Longimicrobiales bacterium]